MTFNCAQCGANQVGTWTGVARGQFVGKEREWLCDECHDVAVAKIIESARLVLARLRDERICAKGEKAYEAGETIPWGDE